MRKEFAWLICPILALGNQLGGTWGAPWSWVSIITVGVFLQLFGKLLNWKGITTIVVFWLLNTLPITLGGDSVTATIYSLLWIWVLGYLQGLWYILHDRHVLLYAFFPMFLYGLFITLSNIPETAHLFPWKFCEGVMGFALGIPFALSIGDEK